MEYQESKLLEHFQPGIFALMDRKKRELMQTGRTVCNLSVGTPDFKPPKHVMEALEEAVRDPLNYRYALADSDELLEAVISYYRRRFGVGLEKNEILAVHGTQEGMGHLGMAVCNPGDVVLLPDPGYPIYEAGSYFGGAEIHYYELVKENHFLPVISEIPEEILRRTRYIVVSYPSNPVGATAPREMYEELIRYANRYGFFIINDNVELARASKWLQHRINEKWMKAGVTMIDPDTTYIGPYVTFGHDVVIHPCTEIYGSTYIGNHVTILGGSTIVDTNIEDNTTFAQKLGGKSNG